MSQASDVALEQALSTVLDRGTPLDALTALEFSLSTAPPGDSAVSLAETAIALDTNVLLKLAAHRKSAEVTDYLSGRHAAPLVLPGQVIQEFWNNHVGSLMTVASQVERKLADLKSSIDELDPHSQLSEAISDLKQRVHDDYHFLYDAGLVSKTKTMLATLGTRAIVPFAKRSSFIETAEIRKRTKTPPGFRDEGHGDFYLWVDLLTGLQQAKAAGAVFARVVVVTNDEKPDWVRNGMAHPILASEVRSLFGVPLEIWKLDQLVSAVDRALTPTVAEDATTAEDYAGDPLPEG